MIIRVHTIGMRDSQKKSQNDKRFQRNTITVYVPLTIMGRNVKMCDHMCWQHREQRRKAHRPLSQKPRLGTVRS